MSNQKNAADLLRHYQGKQLPAIQHVQALKSLSDDGEFDAFWNDVCRHLARMDESECDLYDALCHFSRGDEAIDAAREIASERN